MPIYLFSMSVSLSALQIGYLYHFSRFHIYALMYDICFSLSDLIHSVWQTLSPSASVFHMANCSSSLTPPGEVGRWNVWTREVEARGQMMATRTSLAARMIPPKPTLECRGTMFSDLLICTLNSCWGHRWWEAAGYFPWNPCPQEVSFTGFFLVECFYIFWGSL